MKNKIEWIVILCIGISVGCLFLMQPKKDIKCKFVENTHGQIMLYIEIGGVGEEIHLTDTGGNGEVFFLPSYVTTNVIDLSDFQGVFFDENGEWKGLYIWEEGRMCTVISSMGDVYEIQFIKSSNLSTLFIETESDSLDYIRQDKRNKEKGYLSIVNCDGQYEKRDEKLTWVSGRGNTTFKSLQMGLGFSMETADSICGLDCGKKWNLLSLYYSPDLLKTKIVYDMAEEIGMEYQSDSIWVDLYCNGIYMGVYLLAEPVEVNKTRINIYDLEEYNEDVNCDINILDARRIENEDLAYYDILSPYNISGGYVIEFTPEDRKQSEECFFKLDNSHFLFTIKSPQKTSMEEIKYIKKFVQEINDRIVHDDMDYWRYIDMDSFAQQFVIDLIACEQDAMWDSTFYYKDVNKDILYAGPLWDYDCSFGITQDHIDYTLPIELCLGRMEEWYLSFYDNEQFREKMIDYYIKLLPYIEELVCSRIDEYVEELRYAQKMTELLLSENGEGYHAFSYEQYNNSIRYLKYNMINRCNFLSREWGLDDSYLLELPNGSGEYHKVIFYDDKREIVSEIIVKDGECISDIPIYNESIYRGWRMKSPWLLYNGMLPIYEDTKMFLEKK